MFRTVTIAVLTLFFAGAAGADTATPDDGVTKTPTISQSLEADSVGDLTSNEPAPSAGNCSIAGAEATETLQFMGFFGSHCSNQHNCTYSEPGLGFNCTCYYSCECATCNGTLARINCVLVENDGCFACLLPNNG